MKTRPTRRWYIEHHHHSIEGSGVTVHMDGFWFKRSAAGEAAWLAALIPRRAGETSKYVIKRTSEWARP